MRCWRSVQGSPKARCATLKKAAVPHSHDADAPAVGARAADRSNPHRWTPRGPPQACAGICTQLLASAGEFDALKLHREMTMLLNGRGGHIEQTFLYLDHHSAAAWCAIAEQDAYTSARMAMPMGQVAERASSIWPAPSGLT